MNSIKQVGPPKQKLAENAFHAACPKTDYTILCFKKTNRMGYKVVMMEIKNRIHLRLTEFFKHFAEKIFSIDFQPNPPPSILVPENLTEKILYMLLSVGNFQLHACLCRLSSPHVIQILKFFAVRYLVHIFAAQKFLPSESLNSNTT